MNLTKIEQIAHDEMAQREAHDAREPGWVYYHGRRVAKIALWLCDELEAQVDRDVVYVGALFHDVGKGQPDHNEVGAQMARDLLGTLCTPAELDAVCGIIRHHNQRDLEECTPAEKIVQDADVLDHVGVIGAWLAMYWNGAHGETFHDLMRFIQGEENRRDREDRRAGLNFDVSRRLFDERVAYEEQFFDTFQRVYTQGL